MCSTVHEYGGGAFLVTADAAFFCNFKCARLCLSCLRPVLQAHDGASGSCFFYQPSVETRQAVMHVWKVKELS